MSLCVHAGIQVGELFANGPKQSCFELYVHTMGERNSIVIILNSATFACF